MSMIIIFIYFDAIFVSCVIDNSLR